MPADPPPTGTVSFAFTDIEGSTVRWERDRDAMQDAVRRHDAILRAAIERHGGHVFKTIGDAFCAAFRRPEDAVAAMLDAQRALLAEDFSAVDGLRGHGAIHTGTAELRDGDYSGSAIQKVARLLAIGHGGQILLTEEAAVLVRDARSADASIRDPCSYRLKDFVEPQRAYQFLAPELQPDLPPLRSMGAPARDLLIADAKEFHSVPSFSGRDDELAALHAALQRDGAIAVLHGMGGVGKSSEDGILESLLRLGTTFVHGHFAEGEQLHERALMIRETAHGPDHRSVALSLNNLAVTFEHLGRSTRALPLYTRALAIWETAFGPEHPQVAFGLNNLAGIYRQQGRPVEAEPLGRRSVAIREKALGPEHSELAMSLNFLALVLADQGRFDEAELFHQRALAIREKAFGPDVLAVLQTDRGRFAEAEATHARALSIREMALGAEHPDVAQSLHNLADVYRSEGRDADAEPLLIRALEIRERALGTGHPSTRAAREALDTLCSSA